MKKEYLDDLKKQVLSLDGGIKAFVFGYIENDDIHILWSGDSVADPVLLAWHLNRQIDRFETAKMDKE